jgi:hypothetical protein
MAWTTSACLRAHPAFATREPAHLKAAKRLAVIARRLALRAPSCLFLALTAGTLGILAPHLPTTFTAAFLLITGIAFAMLGAGANLAGAVTMMRADPATPETPPPALEPRHFAASLPPAPSPAGEPSPCTRSVRARQVTGHAPCEDWAALMARVNHELRTPLNAVIGFSEMMALEMFGPLGSERYQDYVRYIRDSAGDLLKSAEDTLALTALLTSPRRAAVLDACMLDHAVADAWSFLARKAAARGVDLDVTLPEQVEVLGEPRALRQILVNMLSEAIGRAAPGAGISLVAIADGELVEIAVAVSCTPPSAVPHAGSLAICLARTLLEMQGTSLLEIENTAGGWRAVTVLDRALQPDFFVGELPAASARRQVELAL